MIKALLVADEDGVERLQAVSQRASRAARPAEPSADARTEAWQAVVAAEERLQARGLQRLPIDDAKAFKLSSASTGKGPAIKADAGPDSARVQALIVHMATVKSRHLEGCNGEPSWLVGTNVRVPQTGARLLEDAMRCNSANSVIVEKKASMGAGNQYAYASNSAAPHTSHPLARPL